MDQFSIGKLSKLTGVSVETIRYYESVGLMPNPPRSSSGQRIYNDQHLARLSFIKKSRDLDFSLDMIRSLLGLNDNPPSCKQVKSLTLTHLDTIRAKIAYLNHLEEYLSFIVKNCSETVDPECPIIDSLYAK